MKKAIIAVSLALTALSASAKDNNTDTLTVTTTPQMHCSGCENKIKSNIRFVKGTKKIITSVADQKVTIIFDKTKASPKDYTAAFAKIGYKIEKKK